MERILIKLSFIAAFAGLIFHSDVAHAFDHPYSSENSKVSIYYNYEANGEDYIAGVGVGVTLKDKYSNLGARFDTTINYAEVLTTDGYLEDYMAWEGSIKFGYFSDISIYGELGIDLTELFYNDWRYDDHNDDYYYDEYNDDIDAFVGAGIGIKLGHLSIEGFTRLREIDSRYWEAESEVFGGVRFSLNF